MKRTFCLLLCLVMMLGLLPAVAAAASEIDEVSISGLEHPVAGRELDTTYKLPSRGIHYEKDDDYAEVVWYDLGTDGSSRTTLKEGDKAVEGHSYIAELHLSADSKYEFRTRKNEPDVEIELSDAMLCRVNVVSSYFDEEEDGEYNSLAIHLSYQADYLYDRKNPVKLTLDEEFDGTVKAGEYPWVASDFSGFPRGHFDLSVTWYEGKQDLDRNKMDDGDKFESGKTYTLKISLDSSRLTRHASFDGDADIMINGERGDTWVEGDISFEAYALFHFTASEGIEKVVIKGIEEPVAGESRQRSGFTCSTDGVEKVEYNRWEVVTSKGETKEFLGQF